MSFIAGPSIDIEPGGASPDAVAEAGPAAGFAASEVELKLFVPSSSVARLWHPSLVELAIGPLRIERIENRYFDTPDRDLARRRMALRLRRIGRRWLQTLKVASADERDVRAASVRGEWEMPVAGPALETARLCDTPFASLGASVRTQRLLVRNLQPVFTTNFRRESRLLRLADGSEVEFAFDVGTIAAGRGKAKRVLPICEVEIERKGNPASDAASDAASPPISGLLDFAATLARDIALIPLAASKASRGYRLADRTPLEPHRTQLPEPHGDDAPRAHLSRVLAAASGALLANVHALFEVGTASASGDGAIEATLDDSIDFVHQARVAVRRLRSALRTFRPVLKGRRFESLDERLQAMGRVFGEARDWDVFMTTTQARLDEEVGIDAAGRDALAALRAAAARRRVDAHRALMGYLDAGDFGRTAIAIERTIDRLFRVEAKARHATLVERAPRWLSDQCERVTSRSRRIAVLDAEERHGLRVEVKRMRYALDLFEALFAGDTVEPFGTALAELQDKLGKLNDAVVAGTLLQSLSSSEGHALAQARFDAWLKRYVRRQLPKVAALAVDLELTTQPWRDEPSA